MAIVVLILGAFIGSIAAAVSLIVLGTGWALAFAIYMGTGIAVSALFGLVAVRRMDGQAPVMPPAPAFTA